MDTDLPEATGLPPVAGLRLLPAATAPPVVALLLVATARPVAALLLVAMARPVAALLLVALVRPAARPPVDSVRPVARLPVDSVRPVAPLVAMARRRPTRTVVRRPVVDSALLQ